MSQLSAPDLRINRLVRAVGSLFGVIFRDHFWGARKNKAVLRSPTLMKSRVLLFVSFFLVRCYAEPVYGLPEALRPVYCFSHKKSVMVLVVKQESGQRSNGDDAVETTTESSARFVYFCVVLPFTRIA